MKPISGKGFTLIEVMIAMVILLVGMLGVMGMQYYAISGNTSSREMRIATSLSQELIEQLTGTPYGLLDDGNDIPTTETAIVGGVNFNRRWWVLDDCAAVTLNNDDNTCTALVSDCAITPGATAVQSTAIRARTCWTDRNGTGHSITIDSLVVN